MNCHTKADPVSSCDNLIQSQAIKILLIIITIVSFFGNSTCLFIIHYEKNQHVELTKTSYLLTVSLFVTNSLLTVYILTILVVDNIFQNAFFHKKLIWQESVLCHGLGFLFTSSKQMTILVTTLMSMEVYNILCKNNKHHSRRKIMAVTIMVVMLSIIIAGNFSWLFAMEFKSMSSLCTFLVSHTLDDFSSYIYHSFNFSMIIFTSFLYLVSVGCIVKTRKIVTQHLSTFTKLPSECVITQHVTKLVAAAAACWGCVCLVILLTHQDVLSMNDSYLAVYSVLLPLTVSLDPVVYLYSVFTERKREVTRAALVHRLKAQAKGARNAANRITKE